MKSGQTNILLVSREMLNWVHDWLVACGVDIGLSQVFTVNRFCVLCFPPFKDSVVLFLSK